MALDEAAQRGLELWSIYGFAVLFTGLRMVARIRIAGWRHLQADDYLACTALVFFSAQAAIAHRGSSLNQAFMSIDIPTTGPPPPEANTLRITGVKLQFTLWPVYSTTLWLLKACILQLYRRLTTSLQGNYRIRILFGIALLSTTWVAVQLTVFLACRPFGNYFANIPAGGNACMPAISRPIVWTCYTLNVITDLYLISLPVPFLWEARMKTWKKVGLGILFSGGFIVIAFATARCVLLTTSKGNASPLAGRWALREAFVAIVTANLPMAFTLVKGLLGPTFWSTRRSAGTELNTMRKGSSRTSGGGGPSGRIRGGLSVVPITTYALFSESEERIYTEQPAHQERDMPTMPKSALSLQWRDMTDDAQVNTREAFGNRL